MDEPQPTRVTPGVPPGVAAETETVRRESAGTAGSAESAPGSEQNQDAKAQAQQKAAEVTQQAKENPLPFAAGGAFVAGFLLGRISKRS
jgi:hypothetical protein